MRHSSPSIFPTLLILPIVHVSAAYREIDQTLAGKHCTALNTTQPFNATGSFTQRSLNITAINETWTWHTGLRIEDYPDNAKNTTPLTKQARQYFWVDTTGDSNLNAPDLDYGVCLTAFGQFNNVPYKDAVKDNGNCEEALGEECVEALYAAATAGRSGDPRLCRSPFTGIPEECKRWQENMFAFSFEISRGFQNDTDQRNGTQNKTCGSTMDNADGHGSYFLSYSLPDDEKEEKEAYDAMVNRTYILFASSFIKNPGSSQEGGTQPRDQFLCLSNTDIAEGSREPEKGGSGRIAASVAGQVVVFLVASLMLLG